MHRLDQGLHELIVRGKKQGFLTYSQINDYLPDEAMNPEKLDELLGSIWEEGLKIVTDDQVGMIVEEKKKPRTRAKNGKEVVVEEKSKKIDDPVRMYLTQMGEIPLLTREKEISLAKTIEVTRNQFREELLECDYALKMAFDTLSKVNSGELPFDRTIKVSVTESKEKNQILGRMPHNLKTIENLRKQAIGDFEKSIDANASSEERKEAEKQHLKRRRKMVKLIEELSLRTQRLQPTMKRLEQISRRMCDL